VIGVRFIVQVIAPRFAGRTAVGVPVHAIKGAILVRSNMPPGSNDCAHENATQNK